MDLHHFYHVYADGAWQDPVVDHLLALRQNGLYQQLKSFNIGFVGSQENIKEVRSFLDDECSYTVVASQPDGFEQITLFELEKFVKQNDGLVSYAHTKGSWHSCPGATIHRRQMEHHNFVDWQLPVYHLTHGAYIAGCWWSFWNGGDIASENLDNYARFFIGNFWWARCDIMRLNMPLKDGYRHYAETWIGQLAYRCDLQEGSTVINLTPEYDMSLRALKNLRGLELNKLPDEGSLFAGDHRSGPIGVVSGLPKRSKSRSNSWGTKKF